MSICYIMIGMSGSGKSTWVKEHAHREDKIASADNFFYRGFQYLFDPFQLQQAHNQCMRDFVGGITRKCPIVFVDNTNLSKDEILPYLKVAQAFGYEVTFVVFCPIHDAETTIQFCASRNIHKIPTKTLEKQYNKFHDSHFQEFLAKQISKEINQISVAFGG